MAQMDRKAYAQMFGPTTGDAIRLADTRLWAEIERDYTVYGDECKFGGGKVIRDGMGQSSRHTRDQGVLDTLITNAVIIDHWGIVKADIGIKDGLIVGIGKAGNPDLMDGVQPGMIVGAGTEVIAGEGKIITAGGIDTHIHYICPQQIETALASGVTTMIGGGTGPAAGTSATTCTPGVWHMHRMLEAAEAFPMNLGFTGKGNASFPEPLIEQVKAGAVGLKLHEDWGTTPAAIDACLKVADQYDVQVAIHTDTLNESGFVEDTLAAIGGRTIHTYHTEGAGGGHAPDIIKASAELNVLPSSTNPTRPYTINTIEEHLDMLMVCHHLDSRIPEDVAFADSRIRPETIAAEDILHDLGVFSMLSSDSQAMGRIGEVIIRTWQTADKMKQQRGYLAAPDEEVRQAGLNGADASGQAASEEHTGETGPADSEHQDSAKHRDSAEPADHAESPDQPDQDNFRIKRYIAKYTINPAITHGISHLVGSVEVGKLADLVVWNPIFFGVKPETVLKGGMIAYAQMGDPNASIPTPQPVMSRPMFGAYGRALHQCITFVSQAAFDLDVHTQLGLQKRIEPVKNCRTVTKKDMVHNGETPQIDVNPETYEVKVDGVAVTCEPAKVLPMAQLYFLF